MKKAVIILAALLCCNTAALRAQTEVKPVANTNAELKTIGFGMHIEQFKLNDVSDLEQAPVNKLILTINPADNFRIEPEFGFKYNATKGSDLKASSISFGVGAFSQTQRNKLNIYGGVRVEVGLMYKENQNTDINGDLIKVANKFTRVMYGPALGGEYYFADNFSIGGEVNMLYVTLKSTVDPKPSLYKESEDYYISTNTGLFLRFYF